MKYTDMIFFYHTYYQIPTCLGALIWNVMFNALCVPNSKLKKLSEDSLTKQPEEVFDVLEKLGEG